MDAGIAQRVKHIPNDVNPSYGPVTYRFEVEGMSVTGSHYLLVRPVYIFGTDGPNDAVTKTKSLPIGAMDNVTVEFTAPVWTDKKGKDVAYWYVGVFQSGSEKATMLLRRMSLKIVQDCVAVEYSDFSVAAEEDFEEEQRADDKHVEHVGNRREQRINNELKLRPARYHAQRAQCT